MIRITNTADVGHISSHNLLRTKELLDPLHQDGLYVNIDEVESGGYSARYHLHTLQDEFFLIMEGQGIARIGDASYEVKTGDFFFKPAGSVPHQFFNNGTEPLKILDCGIARPGDEIIYPDEQVAYLKSIKTAFKLSDALRTWSSTPGD